jgi:hypothetical protein
LAAMTASTRRGVSWASVLYTAHDRRGRSRGYSLETEIPRLLIPWEENWKDGYGLNEVIANAGFSRMSTLMNLFVLMS